VGNGTAENIVIGAAPASPAANTIYTGSGADTLSDVMDAINNAQLGVSASLTSAGTGITLTSSQVGAAGALAVAANVADTTSLTNTTLNYNNSSDINSLTTLGISVNNDGSLALDANALESLLNSDYNSVVGFFQNTNSWGQTFSTMLTNAGSSSSTGILALAAKSNSNTESTLNAEVTKEDSYIATQKTKLTAELNQANQIMQQLPSQLNGMNELYSAITGYNQGSNG
jgi:flagellar hook-associated protein 2